MFTGLIETLGILRARKPHGYGASLIIQPLSPFQSLTIGESIAVDGICLTVTEFGTDYFVADASEETMKTTQLGSKPLGHHVNLERAMAANGRFGGHIVSGHVDETGEIVRVAHHQDSTQLTLRISIENSIYVIPKGSIAVNGISLTVADVQDNLVTLVIIPHSLKETTLHNVHSGEKVNVEYDQIAKYIYRFTQPQRQQSKAPSDDGLIQLLQNNGFI